MFSLSENKVVLGLILIIFGFAGLAMEHQNEGTFSEIAEMATAE